MISANNIQYPQLDSPTADWPKLPADCDAVTGSRAAHAIAGYSDPAPVADSVCSNAGAGSLLCPPTPIWRCSRASTRVRHRPLCHPAGDVEHQGARRHRALRHAHLVG